MAEQSNVVKPKTGLVPLDKKTGKKLSAKDVRDQEKAQAEKDLGK